MEKMNITHKIVAMQPELEHFAYKLTADRESANDLVQDCLLKALDNKEKFVHTQNFKGWMYTIMRNIFINNYRKSLREVDMTDSTYNLYAQTMTEGEEGNRFETIYDLKELYKVINAVPEDLKKPFMMFVAGFGWAKPVPVDMRYFKHPRQGMALTALAGPAANFLTALAAVGVSSAVFHLAPLGPAAVFVLCFLSNMALLGVGMGLFNLIPLPPLDGSKILEMVLPGKLAFAFHNFSYRYSFLLLLFLVFSGMIGRIINPLAQFYTGTTIRLIASVLQM